MEVVGESQAFLDSQRDPDSLRDPEVPAKHGEPLVERPISDYRAGRLRKAVVELYRRRLQPLNLYEPLEHVKRFHESRAPERTLRGSNRSGKTLAAAIEVARAVTGQDVFNKYPKRDGRAFLVGKDGVHLSTVMYRKLFRAGAFWVIRDLKTELWRPYHPWDQEDADRRDERKMAPPLIPSSQIEKIGWENKAEEWPRVIRMKNGWELHFFSSLGKPPQGQDLDLCLAGWSEIYDPVQDKMRRVAEIDGDFHVLSVDPQTKQTRICRAKQPFVKGYGDICRVTLSNGETLYVTPNHRFQSVDGSQVSVINAYEGNVALLAVNRVASCDSNAPKECDKEFQTSAPSPIRRFWQRTRQESHRQDIGISAGLTPTSIPRDAAVLSELLQVMSGTALQSEQFLELGRSLLALPYSQTLDRDLSRLAGYGDDCGLKGSSTQGCQSSCLSCRHPCDALSRPSGELALNVQTLPIDVLESTRCNWSWGVPGGTPRCSRPVPGSGQFLGLHTSPAGSSQSLLPENAPGYQPLSAILSPPGAMSGSDESATAYSVVARRTGREARHFPDPDVRDDLSRVVSLDAGILGSVTIASVEIVDKSLVWDFSVFDTNTYVYGGCVCRNCWLDEEIVDPQWYPEMAARLIDHSGLFIWSATPQAGSDELFDLHEESCEQKDEPNPRVIEIFMHMNANPHMAEADKKLFASKIKSEQERRVRIEGEFALRSFTVYPEFNTTTHGCDPFPIPPDWTRYAIIDPGRQNCAVLFAAVPPEDKPRQVFLYDELYLTNCSAQKFGEAFKARARDQHFYAFIIDHMESRKVEAGSGLNIEMQYSDQLKVQKIRSQATGFGFQWGATDVTGGVEKVRGWLDIRDSGVATLQVFRNKLYYFEHEIQRYRYKRDPGTGMPTDKPDKRNDHLMDCFDEKTEVLTDSGWKHFRDLGGMESLATVNLGTDEIEYQVPLDLISKPYSGDMFAFGGRKMDALVTPTHRMVVYPREACRGYNDGQPTIKTAEEVSIWDRLKLHAHWTGTRPEVVLVPHEHNGTDREKELDPHLFAEFLGWYVAEGCCVQTIQTPGRGYQVILSQSPGLGKDILRALLDQLPWKFREFHTGFSASSKQLWCYLNPLGNSYTKRVPDWVKTADTETIRRFVVGAVLGDGWHQGNNRTYVSVSRQLADDMQELFIKLGRTASVRRRKAQPYCIKGRCGTNTVDQHWVNEWKLPVAYLRDSKNRPNFEAVPYEGNVYCATVPNGTLIVRRNGKPLVAGNCLRYLAMYGPKWHPRVKLPGAKSWARREIAKKKKLLRNHSQAGRGYVRLGPG